jgi:EthD domain
MSEKPRTQWRLLALLSSAPDGVRELPQRLAMRRSRLSARFGKEAEILLGVRRADDPFSKIGGDRKIDSADAILQATWPEESSALQRIDTLDGLSQELRDDFDIGQSALAVGTAYFMVERKGDVFCAFLGRRDPRVTLQQMQEWWLYHHAPLAISLTVARAPHGYDQLHVDPETSRKAADAAGFPYVPYDMADSLYIPNLGEFVKGTSDPEIARQLYEDEVGFLDHTSWRGAFTDTV